MRQIEGTDMMVVRIALWGLATLAGAIWFYCETAFVEAHFGTTVLASWASQVGILDQSTSFSLILQFFFLTTIVLSGVLCGFKISIVPSPVMIALRGAPRWLRRTIYLSSAATLIAAIAHQWPPAADANPHPDIVLATASAALISGISCLIFVSGARLGLLPPKCPNGHPVRYDVGQCSNCGAAIANVEL